MPLAEWHLHAGFYLVLIVFGIPLTQRILTARLPFCALKIGDEVPTPRLFDCFLYHDESYMLLLRLLTLSRSVEKFIIGISSESLSYSPFEDEIQGFSDQIVFLPIHLAPLLPAVSARSNGTSWRRQVTARNLLMKGLAGQSPNPDDLIILSDVCEIPTRSAVSMVKRRPPVHYYNLPGVSYHYSFRWRVGDSDRPLLIRFGSIAAPLDDYRHMPGLFPLPGVLHHHCGFCFPTIRSVIRHLKSLDHGNLADPNYIYARIACGFGLLRSDDRLTLVDFDPEIFIPNDARFDFLTFRIAFRDLGEFRLRPRAMRQFRQPGCTVMFRSDMDIGMAI